MEVVMTTAKLFMNGRSQAVRLPKEFRFDNEEEVLVKRMGDAIMLIPKSRWKHIFIDAIKSFPGDVDFSREGNSIPQDRDIDL
jgi:antitoxin VapB